jgi:hypothetical protein
MKLSNLPLEVSELIFREVVWDEFQPEVVEDLNSASECIDHLRERNRQLRALRPTAKFVDCIVNRLAYKYVHITSKTRAEEMINAADDRHIQGTAVRHLFLGDKSGRYHLDNGPSYSWVSAEYGKEWIDSGTFGKLLVLMPNVISLHIHLPAIHSQIFQSSVRHGMVAPLSSLNSIRCLSLYDDINNTPCYELIRRLDGVRESLSAFPNLQHLVVSESEGVRSLDKLYGFTSSQVTPKWYAPRLRTILLEKWVPVEKDVILYNFAMDIPLRYLQMSRRVPRRLSMNSISLKLSSNVDMDVIVGKVGPSLTSLHLDFSYHFADDLLATNFHLCATIRDNCQNLEYLTLKFPPPDNVHDSPRASVCHQLFRAPGSFMSGAGMLNLKKAEIIGDHSYCEGSSRKMIIEASEEVWERQNEVWWEASSESGTLDHECLHTNIQVHGTPASRASLLNCRELCGIQSTLSELSSHGDQGVGRCLEDMHESSGPDLIILAPPPRPFTPSKPVVTGRVPPQRIKKRKFGDVP